MATKTLQFIEKAVKKHGDKYNYSKVSYTKCEDKVTIVCSEHGEFEQIPSDHLSGNGCQRCGRKKCAKTHTSSTNKFIEKAKKIHGDKYNYSKVSYTKAKNKVTIICAKHGEFQQTPDRHLHGGCMNCGREKTGMARKSNTLEFIENAKKKHGDRYDYSKLEYTKAVNKIIIICKDHGEFEQYAIVHSTGSGCPKCANNVQLSNDEFIEKAKSTHGDKYDYSKSSYVKTNQKVIIICKEHGEFLQTPNHHLGGQGCVPCSCVGFSKMQIEWLDYTAQFHGVSIQHARNGGEHKIKTTKWQADGYCEETNTVYEFNGDFYHGNPEVYEPEYVNPVLKKSMGELYKSTIERENKIKELGYNLVVMWEYDWKKMIEQ